MVVANRGMVSLSPSGVKGDEGKNGPLWCDWHTYILTFGGRSDGSFIFPLLPSPLPVPRGRSKYHYLQMLFRDENTFRDESVQKLFLWEFTPKCRRRKPVVFLIGMALRGLEVWAKEGNQGGSCV